MDRNMWSLFFMWITISQEQNIYLGCNDTHSWSNKHDHSCSVYEFNGTHGWWCPNGTYTPDTMRTGGNTYKYPEFNCCACGEGWQLWFVPSSGYTAMKAIPEMKTDMPSKLICNDSYRNPTACTMKCKALQDDVTVTSLETMTTEDFNVSNCILDLNMNNNSVQYILQIPVDNYLIYFTNWKTNDYNLSCVNRKGIATSRMLCRYDVEEHPFKSPSCPSGKITSRYIRPDCVDTDNWRNSHHFSCFEYEMTWHWCANGTFTQENSWTGGAIYYYPEENCCACGKGLLSPFQLTSITNSFINSSEFKIVHLKNCYISDHGAFNFDLKCLALLSFVNTNMTMNSTLYNCPLSCFFDRNNTQIKNTQSINVSRRLFQSSISYYLTSNRFSPRHVVCELLVDVEPTSTYFFPIPTTSEQTIEQPTAWQPLTCPNDKIGLNCSENADICSLAKPCLNNGTCLNTDSSYNCSCLPGRFTGKHCEIDIRPCKLLTCLSRGICNETSLTSFICQCDSDYEGIHCESLVNYCHDVKCQNNAQCRPSLLNFTCECTTEDFSGRYCEMKSSSLTTKQTVNRSFAYIAIIAMAFVAGFIVLLDILKYGFHIDPVDEDRKRLQAEKDSKKKQPVIIQRFIYVNKPKLETIPEER